MVAQPSLATNRIPPAQNTNSAIGVPSPLTFSINIYADASSRCLRLAASHRDDLGRNHSDSSRCASRQVKYSTRHKRPTVVHSNIYRSAITWVSDDQACSKRKCSMSSGQSERIELLA